LEQQLSAHIHADFNPSLPRTLHQRARLIGNVDAGDLVVQEFRVPEGLERKEAEQDRNAIPPIALRNRASVSSS